MRKVLFVVDEKKLGGVNVVLENLLNNIDLTNLSVDLLILHNTGAAFKNLNEKINVIYGTPAFNIVDQDFKTLLRKGKILDALRKANLSLRMKTNKINNFILKQRKQMKLQDYDTEIAFKSGFCSFVVAYSNAKHKINWIHEDYATYNKTKRYEDTFKDVFNMFDLHVVVSSDAAKSFNDIYNMESKTCIIENYINETLLIEEAKDTRIVLDKEKINITTLGRLCYEKGFDRLIVAVKALKEKLQELNIKVNILGYGELEQSLNKQIEKLQLSEYIQLYNTGKMETSPYAFIRESDIFIMPSRSESFGMTRIEALILGVPVITTNVANSDKLIPKEYGIIVENSLEGIIDGIEKLITNKQLLTTLKENLKNYSYTDTNKNIIQKVQKLLEE